MLAAEIMFPPLVKANPYQAGLYAVLTNANDVYAMGGYPIALVDVILAEDTDGAAEVCEGCVTVVLDTVFHWLVGTHR